MSNIEIVGSAEAARLLQMDKSSLTRAVQEGLIPIIGRLPTRQGALVFDRAVIVQLAKERSAERRAAALRVLEMDKDPDTE